MRIEANLLVDELLSNLLKDNNIDRPEVSLSVCQLLKTLGLAKLNVTENPKNLKEVNFTFYHTQMLKNISRNNQVSEERDNNNNDNDNNDNDNDNDNNNTDEDEERVRRSKSGRKR